MEERLLDRAIRLLEFLTQVQQITSKPVRHVDAYAKADGSVLWFHDIPDHPAITSAERGGDPEPDTPLLVLDRVPRQEPPLVPDELTPWVAGRLDDPSQQPVLKESTSVPAERNDHEAPTPATVLHRADHPELAEAFAAWLRDWQAWADEERQARPARQLYGELFRVQQNAVNAPEEWETLVALGALGWHPEGYEPVLRHVLAKQVRISSSTMTPEG